MRKISFCASLFMLAGLCFNVNAAQLEKATVTSPSGGQYQTYLTSVSVSWGTPVKLVDPLFNRWDEEYVEIPVNIADNKGVADGYLFVTDASLSYFPEMTIDFYTLTYDPSTYDRYYGTYIIDIPEGIVMSENGDTNPAQTLEFIVLQGKNEISIVPKDEETYNAEALKEVVVTFDGNITPILPTSPIMVVPRAEGDSFALEENLIEFRENEIVLDLSELPIGPYYIDIPAGIVSIANSEGNYINTKISLTYTIWDGLNSATVLQPSSITNAIVPIHLTWDYQTVYATENGLSATIRVGYYGDDVLIEKDAFSFNDIPADNNDSEPDPLNELISGNMLSIDLSSYLENIESGDRITVTIPAGIVETMEGLKNPEQTIEFRYYAAFPEEAQISEEENVLMVSWPGTEQLSVMAENDIFIEYADGNRKYLAFDNYGWDDGEVSIPTYGDYGYRVLMIDLNDLDLPNGEYLLVIPDNYVIIYKEYDSFVNGEIFYSFEVKDGNISTSIEEINNEEGVYHVYNIQGINLLNTTDRNALKQLKNGLYIINGKKIIVRN